MDKKRFTKYVIDVSTWNDFSTQMIESMKVNLDLEGVVIKCGQGTAIDSMFLKHYGRFANQKVKGACYYWFDPLKSSLQQARFLVDLIQKYPVKTVFIDVEQWWADWELWRKSNAGELDDDGNPIVVPVIPANTILDKLLAFSEYIRAYMKSEDFTFTIGWYTANWFIYRYCPKFCKEIIKRNPQDPFWIASYRNYASYDSDKNCTINEFEQYKRAITEDKIQIVIPSGVPEKNLVLWQFDDRLPMNGFPRLDMNLASSEEFVNLFSDLVPLYQSTGKRVTTVAKMRLRVGPSTKNAQVGNIVTAIGTYDVLEVKETATETWAKIDYYNLSGWICVKLGKVVYGVIQNA